MPRGRSPGATEFEDSGGRFFHDRACSEPDRLLDDQALYLDAGEGLVVLLGCAHAGVINTLKRVHELAGRRSIQAVIGGMHLVKASTERLIATGNAFADQGTPLLAPAHCTGVKASSYLWSRFPGRCVPCHVGATFTFNGR